MPGDRLSRIVGTRGIKTTLPTYQWAEGQLITTYEPGQYTLANTCALTDRTLVMAGFVHDVAPIVLSFFCSFELPYFRS